jgi:hypothetical protein
MLTGYAVSHLLLGNLPGRSLGISPCGDTPNIAKPINADRILGLRLLKRTVL